MIKIEKIKVEGWEPSIRGMRNPLDSWEKSDSIFGVTTTIGPNDMSLMEKLVRAGTEHRKFMRMIVVWMDITAPLYWWKEFDTYKVGTTANSCSTMHKLTAKEFTLDDFSHEHLHLDETELLKEIISTLNCYRDLYNESKWKDDWWQMIQLLPSSYNQKRTVTMNYENVYSMIRQRTDHKLDEWNEFVVVLKGLPGVKEMFVFETEGQNV